MLENRGCPGLPLTLADWPDGNREKTIVNDGRKKKGKSNMSIRTKPFEVHFRYRNGAGELHSLLEVVETTSKARAKEWGKRIAEERAPSWDGKYWLMEVLTHVP